MSRSTSERGQLDLFHALPGEFAVRDAQDVMSYPFFSLSKSHRTRPIEFAAGGVEIRVEAVADHGMATIWDADILIWAASQIVEAVEPFFEIISLRRSRFDFDRSPAPLIWICHLRKRG